MQDEGDYRLPRTVIPSRYELTLEPDLDAATFAGFESVAIEVREAVDEVVVNAVELEIEEAWLEGPAGARIDAAVTLDEEREQARLALGTTAQPGSWTMHARFRGVLNDKLRGFYRSTFTNGDGSAGPAGEGGEEQVIATTQFEATDARRAFPCWDEPDLKAVFSVSLVVGDGLTALSNAAAVADEPTGDGRRVVRFADTMVMSTYLVAFIVGPLELTDPVDVDGTPLRIAHVPGKGHLTAYALEAGAFSLRFFADYYGIPYPGDKLDLVALPDFAFGAMENLGCVTFREALLIVDPDAVTHDELQRVADVIAHEIAHMWFGDLVTMRWWNGIWLNEAFATFMELTCVDAFKPEWDRWVSFGLERSAAFDVDSLRSTRPIEYPVLSPHDAEGMFDVLTYQKGAAVLRMLERYLDEDSFRAGIRHYLDTHRYGNTETTDLWDSLEEVTGQPTRRIMDSWIFQGGYPVVGVETAMDGTVLRLTQRRFSFTPEDASDAAWAVPVILSFGTDGAAQVRKVLLDGDALEIDLPEPVEWVVANAGGHGFYRVGYSPELLTALTSRAQRQLTPIERYGLIDDAWASVLAGDLAAPSFLDLIRGFADETDAAVWKRIVAALGSLDRVIDAPARERFQGFVRALLGPVLRRMGWTPDDGETELHRDLRGTLVRALGVLGDDREVHEKARALHDRPDRDSVDPAIMAAAVDVLANVGGGDRFDEYVDAFKNASTPQEQLRYLYALAAFPEEDLVRRALDMALSGDVRTQNAPFLVNRALHNRDNGAMAWRFVRQSWDALNDRLPSNSIVRMLEGVRSLSDPAVANDVFGFFAEHEVPQGAKTLEQHLDRLRVNLALREREAERLAAALP
jgi:puromycin-sensitive aminopeptidase